jgi:hypothetical protein
VSTRIAGASGALVFLEEIMSRLFVVPKQQVEQSRETEETGPELFGVSGDTGADLETALRTLAFLMEFIEVVGPDELRRCADEIHAFRVRQ